MIDKLTTAGIMLVWIGWITIPLAMPRSRPEQLFRCQETDIAQKEKLDAIQQRIIQEEFIRRFYERRSFGGLCPHTGLCDEAWDPGYVRDVPWAYEVGLGEAARSTDGNG